MVAGKEVTSEDVEEVEDEGTEDEEIMDLIIQDQNSKMMMMMEMFLWGVEAVGVDEIDLDLMVEKDDVAEAIKETDRQRVILDGIK